ncbi:MAG: caspase family protein [Cyclobacteriaceae bacterium]
MSKALCVGIGRKEGEHIFHQDAERFSKLLKTHENGDPNFTTKLLTATGETYVTETSLRRSFRWLINSEEDMAVFYYSGHGTVTEEGAFLCTEDRDPHDPGLAVNDLISMVNNNTRTKQVVIILDCCFAGGAGNNIQMKNDVVQLRKGLSILAASQDFEVSRYENYKSVFTDALEAGLRGEAADAQGHVTVASLYYYADKLLNPWEQRPLLKTHTSHLRPIRKCNPRVEANLMRQLTVHFPDPDSKFPLDPSYPGSSDLSDPAKLPVFRDLQELCRNALVEPVGEEHMYYAAMHNKSCQLTHQGKMYWRMVEKGMV